MSFSKTDLWQPSAAVLVVALAVFAARAGCQTGPHSDLLLEGCWGGVQTPPEYAKWIACWVAGDELHLLEEEDSKVSASCEWL